jgi:hypothetical protein
MERRSLAIALAILAAMSSSAWAQGNGNGGGNGGGQGSGNGQGQSENASGNSGQNGNAYGRDNAGGRGEEKSNAAASHDRELSENDALAAVAAGRAVELSAILPDVRSRTGGEVINAQLQQVGGFLIYAVKVLTPAGQVLTEHYYARTGVHIAR